MKSRAPSADGSRSSLPRRAWVRTLGRSQITSLVATVVDFGSLLALTEELHLWYVASTAVGASLGAVTNFLFNRHWSFEATEQKTGPQAIRYALVSAGSLALNTLGVYVLTAHTIGTPYPVSKVITALAVGLLYNYPLQRAWVFSSRSGKQ